MIQFKSLKFKNLCAYGNYWTEVDLGRGDCVAVVGVNGAGKSSAILDGLTFCLFGKPFRKINKGRLVNTVNNKDCVSEVVFVSGDTEYRVVRGLKPTIFEIYIDGEKVDQNAKSVDLQEYLEKTILGYSYKTSNQIVVLGSATFAPFMQLSASDRRAVIEDLLDASSYSKMLEVTKRMSSTIRSRISDRREQERILNEREKGKLELLNQVRTHAADTIIALEEDLKAAASRYVELHEKWKESASELATYEPGFYRHVQCREDSRELSLRRTYAVDREKKALDGYETARSADYECGRCGQHFPPSEVDIQRHRSAYEEARTDRETAEAAEAEGLAGLKETKADHDEHVRLSREIASLKGEALTARKVVEECQAKLKASKTPEDGGKESEIRDQITEIRSGLAKIAKNISNDQVLLRHVNACSEILRDDGVKAKLIKTYLPIINELVNKYLSMMDFNISFHLDEQFAETIKSRHRDTFQYESFSEGEKKRIDIALLFTWREIAKLKNSASTNVLILDEIVDGSMDDLGKDDFIRILHSLENVSRFVITHDQETIDRMDRVITATKEKGFSYLNGN